MDEISIGITNYSSDTIIIYIFGRDCVYTCPIILLKSLSDCKFHLDIICSLSLRFCIPNCIDKQNKKSKVLYGCCCYV